MTDIDALDDALDDAQALAVIVAYTEDDYLREHGTLSGSASTVAEAILNAGFQRIHFDRRPLDMD